MAEESSQNAKKNPFIRYEVLEIPFSY